jgi:hypothetical protein
MFEMGNMKNRIMKKICRIVATRIKTCLIKIKSGFYKVKAGFKPKNNKPTKSI